MGATFYLPTGLTDEMIDPSVPEAALDGINGWLALALSGEPEPVGTRVGRGPTTRWIGYTFGDFEMTKLVASSKLPLKPGDPNPFFQAMDSMTQEGLSVVRGVLWSDLAIIDGVTRLEWLHPQRLLSVVLAGGDVHNQEVVFQIAEANIDDEVPVALPNATYETETETVNRTWAEYHDEVHEVHHLGTDYFIFSNSFGPVLKASELYSLMMAPPTGVTVISIPEFLVIQAANPPE